MKIIFEFDTCSENFYDYCEGNKLYVMQNASNIAHCLECLREFVRTLIKHDSRELIPKDEIDDKFWDIINEHNINFKNMGY